METIQKFFFVYQYQASVIATIVCPTEKKIKVLELNWIQGGFFRLVVLGFFTIMETDF